MTFEFGFFLCAHLGFNQQNYIEKALKLSTHLNGNWLNRIVITIILWIVAKISYVFNSTYACYFNIDHRVIKILILQSICWIREFNEKMRFALDNNRIRNEFIENSINELTMKMIMFVLLHNSFRNAVSYWNVNELISYRQIYCFDNFVLI